MMKKLTLSFLTISILGLVACSEDLPTPIDTTFPTISKLEAASQIEPYPGQVIPPDWGSIRFYFNVMDPEGISEVSFEVKGSFPDPTQSSLSNKFELFNHSIVYNKDTSDPRYNFQFGLDQLNFDPLNISWNGTYSVANLPILAGPYDVIINAQDINGNKTSEQNGATYQTIVFVERYYSPLIHRPFGIPEVVTMNADEDLAIEGGILKTDDQLSTPLKFIWVKLADQDILGDYKGTTNQVVYDELMWGESLRLDLAGKDLPSVSEITFDQLFEAEPLNLPSGISNLVLIVWAEDEAGNVSRKVIPIEVN